MKECVTHHNACDCREAKFARLEAKLVEAESHIRALIDGWDNAQPFAIMNERCDGAEVFLDTLGGDGKGEGR